MEVKLNWRRMTRHDRMELCIAAISAMADEDGNGPSVREFDAKRHQHGDLPKSQQVKILFGMGWPKLLEHCGLKVRSHQKRGLRGIYHKTWGGEDDVEIILLANRGQIQPSPLVTFEPETKRFYHWSRRCWVVAELAEVR